MDDVVAIAEQGLRAADVEECEALGLTPLVAMTESFEIAQPFVFTAVYEGTPVALFGLSHMDEVTGSPWLLATDGLRDGLRIYLSEAPQWVLWFNRLYPILFNYVHVNNLASKRWLKTLGFVLEPPIPYGPLSAPFHPFHRRAENHAP